MKRKPSATVRQTVHLFYLFIYLTVSLLFFVKTLHSSLNSTKISICETHKSIAYCLMSLDLIKLCNSKEMLNTWKIQTVSGLKEALFLWEPFIKNKRLKNAQNLRTCYCKNILLKAEERRRTFKIMEKNCCLANVHQYNIAGSIVHEQVWFKSFFIFIILFSSY